MTESGAPKHKSFRGKPLPKRLPHVVITERDQNEMATESGAELAGPSCTVCGAVMVAFGTCDRNLGKTHLKNSDCINWKAAEYRCLCGSTSGLSVAGGAELASESCPTCGSENRAERESIGASDHFAEVCKHPWHDSVSPTRMPAFLHAEDDIITSPTTPAAEVFASRSQEKRIRTMRGDKNPLDPRSEPGEKPIEDWMRPFAADVTAELTVGARPYHLSRKLSETMIIEKLVKHCPPDRFEAPEDLVITIARELYDRFMMGGWEPQDAYPQIREWLMANRLEVSAEPPSAEKGT